MIRRRSLLRLIVARQPGLVNGKQSEEPKTSTSTSWDLELTRTSIDAETCRLLNGSPSLLTDDVQFAFLAVRIEHVQLPLVLGVLYIVAYDEPAAVLLLIEDRVGVFPAGDHRPSGGFFRRPVGDYGGQEAAACCAVVHKVLGRGVRSDNSTCLPIAALL